MLCEQGLQSTAVTGHDRIAPRVAAIADDLHAAAPDAVDHAASPSEDPAVQDLVFAAFNQRRMIRRKADNVQGRPGLQAHRFPAGAGEQRLGATAQGTLVQAAARRAVMRWHQYIARAVREPLRVLQRAQLLGCIQQDVRVAANSKSTALREERRGRKDAISKARLRYRAQADDGAACRHPPHLRLRDMGGMYQAPALIGRLRLEQPLDRAAAAPGDAVLDLLRLL